MNSYPCLFQKLSNKDCLFFSYLGMLIYKAANLFDVTQRWSMSLNFIANISIPFSFFLRVYLIGLVIGKSPTHSGFMLNRTDVFYLWNFCYKTRFPFGFLEVIKIADRTFQHSLAFDFDQEFFTQYTRGHLFIDYRW